MFKARREALRELLLSKPFVSLEEMREMFPDVSEMTLRRDVEFFENEGLVIKVRGGCRSVGQISAQGGEVVNLSAKRSIAEAAVSFLETGRSIFIDSGTTMRTFSEYIPDKRYAFTTTEFNGLNERVAKAAYIRPKCIAETAISTMVITFIRSEP